MVHETPELFKRIVSPYIDAFPPSRTQWCVAQILISISKDGRIIYIRVDDILAGKSEAEKILFKDSSPSLGYVILPDMKWDLSNTSALYLVAISNSKEIRCLRDLRKHHLPMLRGIRREATRVVNENWGLNSGSLRFYIHYQPSYCETSENIA